MPDVLILAQQCPKQSGRDELVNRERSALKLEESRGQGHETL